MNCVSLGLCGASFTIRSNAADLDVTAEYAPFLISSASTPTEFGACWDVAAPANAPVLFPSIRILWGNEVWRLSATVDRRLAAEVAVPGADGLWHSAAVVEPDFAGGTLFPLRQDRAATIPLHHPHDRPLLLGRLAHMGGGIVHSSAVVDRDRALLFVGPSGAGKTTVARLWRSEGATILNDERNIVRIAGTGPRVGSSPWHGEENEVNAMSRPLAGIFFLRQAAENSLHPVRPFESAARLFAATFVPVFLAEGPELILDAWARVADAVPSFDIHFTPDAEHIPMCRSAVGLV